MKIRSGYVSNSSSSSFIVAFDENAKVKLGESDEFTIDDFFEVVERSNRNWSSDETSLVASGEENVRCHEKDRWSYDYDEGRKYLKELEGFFDSNRRKGVDFATVRISYHDKMALKLYNAFKQAGGIIEFNEQEE